ncbi:MAG: methyltransferase domain-containing protein [Rhizomicrobium sp.]
MTPFAASRSLWWNADFLQLMASRWKIRKGGKLLDVGCGAGHWTKPLCLALEPMEVCCLDQNTAGFQEVEVWGRSSAADVRCVLGDIYSIPLGSDYFDVVTCQTVMIHLADVQRGIVEMLRVAKPGARIIFAEPVELSNCAALSPFFLERPAEEIARHMLFWARCGKGQSLLGKGDNNIGEKLPGLLADIGLLDIQVYQSDKAFAVVPPYANAEAKLLLDEEVEWLSNASEGQMWDEQTVSVFHAAGGGNREEYSRYKEDVLARLQVLQTELLNGSYHRAGARTMYLISAMKPPK